MGIPTRGEILRDLDHMQLQKDNKALKRNIEFVKKYKGWANYETWLIHGYFLNYREHERVLIETIKDSTITLDEQIESLIVYCNDSVIKGANDISNDILQAVVKRVDWAEIIANRKAINRELRCIK